MPLTFLIAITVLLIGVRLSRVFGSGPCDPPVINPIVCENSKPGSPPAEWDLPNHDQGDTTIQGFASPFSINRGETVYFKINTDARNYRIDIYRLGYYGGLGARLVQSLTPSAALPQTQPRA
jgi:hypothetical protein